MPNIGSTGGAIPAGGTSGQTLTKNSGTDYDASWAAASASAGANGGFPFVSGRNYPAFSYVASAAVTGNPPSNMSASLFFLPTFVPNACTISTLSMYMPGASNSYTIWGGLYTDTTTGASGGPATKLAAAAYVTSASAGWISCTLNAVVSKAQTLWVMLATNNSAVNMYTVINNSTSMYVGPLVQLPTAPNNSRWTNSYNYSNPPADMTTTNSNAQNSYLPITLLTVA